MADAGIAEVWNAVEKLPPAPIPAVVVMPSIVMETISLVGGMLFPALMVPERLIEAVPA